MNRNELSECNDVEGDENDEENAFEETKVAMLLLPHGVRNISTKMLESNSVMLDSSKQYAVAGVRYAKRVTVPRNSCSRTSL